MMEGWLYLIRSNRLGLQHSRKLYFVLDDGSLKSFKSVPGSASVVFFNFTLNNTADQNDQLKLGASSPEEAARWIHSLQESAIEGEVEPGKSFTSCSKSRRRSSRLDGYDWMNYISSVDRNFSRSSLSDLAASDVLVPSPWTIFGCQNGLRLFKESRTRTMPECGMTIPQQWMLEWWTGPQNPFSKNSCPLVPQDHYGISVLVKEVWLNILMVMLTSFTYSCAKIGYLGGGYVVSPLNNGKQSAVKHMLAIDWKYWKSYMWPSSGRSITVKMLERVAALRELFQAKMGSYPSSEISSG